MENSTQKAITYSLLAHIRNSGTLSKGPLDIFIPLVKKGLHFMNNRKDQYKGESIKEINEIVLKEYSIDIPISVLRSILMVISKEINKGDERIFVLNNDDSFWIKDYIFDDYDLKFQEYQNEVNILQNLFQEFCKANGIENAEKNCIIKFIEKNKHSISKYLANSKIENGDEFIIEAKFIDYFKHNATVFTLIKNIYLGSILTSYLDYQPTNLKLDVTLLFDTNFIISLLDLNTPESTHTCRKLLEVCNNIGYKYQILNDTIEETRNLLKSKSANFDNAILLKYVNREDIYNACERRNLNRSDLDRISDNLEETIEKFGIFVIKQTTSLRNKARFSSEYRVLKTFRNTEKAALHDAEAIIYVKDKRGKRIKEFENVNSWFVNNSISHDTENEGLASILNSDQLDYQPEIIKVDDLLNILWLSNPNINTSIVNDEIVDIGLTELVSFTLNKALPKARIIKELDFNIQKYSIENISERDIFLISTRIANGQFRSIEKLNELAKINPTEFNGRIKEEIKKQEEQEKERNEKIEVLLKKLNDEYNQIGDLKIRIEKDKENEIQKIKEEASSQITQTERDKENEIQRIKDGATSKIIKQEEEIKRLKIENIKSENKSRTSKRELFIYNCLRKWRRKTWITFTISFAVLLILLGWTIFLRSDSSKDSNSIIEKIYQNETVSVILSILTSIFNFFVIRALYDKYYNHSNINAYKSSIKIPDELQDLPLNQNIS